MTYYGRGLYSYYGYTMIYKFDLRKYQVHGLPSASGSRFIILTMDIAEGMPSTRPAMRYSGFHPPCRRSSLMGGGGS